MVFTGTFEHTIDAKNRLAIPADIRAQFRQTRGGKGDEPRCLYVTLGEGQVLCLYTEEEFQKRADELDQSDQPPDDLLAYETVFFSLSRRVELDKNGRVRLPENLLDRAQLGPQVVVLGAKDHLEIRNREAWTRHVEKTLAEETRFRVVETFYSDGETGDLGLYQVWEIDS